MRIADTTDTLNDDFAAAMRRSDYDRAEQLLDAMGKAVPGALLEPAADLLMQRRRWAEAARLLGRIVDQNIGQQCKRRLARNMAELVEYRPNVAERLAQAPQTSQFQIAPTPSGALTILYQNEAGQTVILSAAGDPAASLRQSMAQLAEALSNHAPIGVYGLGDGYLLSELAGQRTTRPLEPHTCVHVMIAEPQHLMCAMTIHDYTGETGPIRQKRFQWWVGDDWAEQIEATMRDDPQLPFTAVNIEQGEQGSVIAQQMRMVGKSISDTALAMQPRINTYYEQLDTDELAAVFGDDPPRTPRALVITSRFTTVLQHSARDSADALRRLGWQVELLIEKSDHHQITGTAIQRLLDAHRPDMVFVIDHLRSEYPAVFPMNLPWICWVQDHLSNLTNRKAGASITRRDFVLTPFGPLYNSRHDYPARQIVPLGKLTRIPQRPMSWQSDGDDFTFVSHASRPPVAIIDEIAQLAANDPNTQKLIRTCGQRMMELYERGQSLGTPYDVRQMLEATERDTGIIIGATDMRPLVVDMLFTNLNNALYRHQALGWFADIAESMGLTLSLYGHGWEDHPRFAKYARGAVMYGDELENLARRTKINLQIVPFFCLHQRLLDGLVAGGFYLVRANPYDTIAQQMVDFLDKQFGQRAIDSVDAARDVLDASQHAAFEQVLEICTPLAERGDPVGIVQSWRRAGWIVPRQNVLPHFEDVMFDSPESARRCVERFIHDEYARRSIADAQRQNIESRLSYTAGLQRVTQQVGRLIHEERHRCD